MTSSLRFNGETATGLEWVQPDHRDDRFELRGSGETYAVLRYLSRRRQTAVARAGDSAWEFGKRGLFRKQVTVRLQGSGTLLAVMDPSGASEGVLRSADGAGVLTSLRWGQSADAWETEDDWVIRYHNNCGPRTYQAKVEMDGGVLGEPELPLLLVLGWYLVLRSYTEGLRNI